MDIQFISVSGKDTTEKDQKMTGALKRSIGLRPLSDFSHEEKEKMYLDWVNNFLTVPVFARYYYIGDADAHKLIKEQHTLQGR